MEPDHFETAMTAAERKFRDYMKHGDDFCKIELWRPARNWYKKALALNIERERVMQKIADCDRSIAYEVKIIWRLVAIAAVLVLACIMC
jgi:hypothetical protein